LAISSSEENNTAQDYSAKIQDEKTRNEIKKFASKIYIELTTRKTAIPIDENTDVIEEIYNSWYKLFCIIRDEMKLLPADCLKDLTSTKSAIGLSNKILNDILRPHLTEHQAKFRKWLEYAKQESENRKLTPQELQKKYPDYESLMKSIKMVNKILIDAAEELFNFSR
jgi:hypothetical protein